MEIIANIQVQMQPLAVIEHQVFLFIDYYAKKFGNHVTVGVENISNWIGRTPRTALAALRSLVSKGFITRKRRGKGNNALTQLTEKGREYLEFIHNNIKERAEMPISHQTSHQNDPYIRSIKIKSTEVELDDSNKTVLRNEAIDLPSLMPKRFSSVASKVLSKINRTIRRGVIGEYDQFSKKSKIRNPVAFLRYLVNRFKNVEGEIMERISAQDRIDREVLEKNLKDRAMTLAREELKRIGKVYPTFDSSRNQEQHFDALRDFAHIETKYYNTFLRQLEREHGLRA